MTERYVIDGVEAILVNAEEIEASRLVFGGMTEPRIGKYGAIEEPHPYYTGLIEFNVQYRDLVLTSTLGYAERSFCKVRMGSMIIDAFSSYDMNDVQELFFDDIRHYIDSKEEQVKVSDYLKQLIVTNMVQLYEKYHHDGGQFHDFTPGVYLQWSRLKNRYLHQKECQLDAAKAHEQEVLKEISSKLQAGEYKREEARALRVAAQKARHDIKSAIHTESEMYALSGCVYYCRENYGVNEEAFCEFIQKHYTGHEFDKLMTDINKSKQRFMPFNEEPFRDVCTENITQAIIND